MSYFAILAQYGNPQILVEVGQKISKDPLLLSALFEAMNNFSHEIADSPLQIMQTKGFTVEFKQLENDFILILGTNKHVVGLESLIGQIHNIIVDGERYKIDDDTIENEITAVLLEYDRISEDNSNILREEINIKTRRALENISLDYYKILFWGLLTGTHLRYPKTDSIDINENLLIIGEFFSIKYCTPLDPSCTYHITFDSSKLKFKTNFANPRNLIKDTDILRSLLIKVKNKQYLELKILLLSYLETLKTFTAIALRYNKDDKKIIHEIENLRYLSGMEIEHYMMIRLKRESELIYNILKTETQAIEWMNSW